MAGIGSPDIRDIEPRGLVGKGRTIKSIDGDISRRNFLGKMSKLIGLGAVAAVGIEGVKLFHEKTTRTLTNIPYEEGEFNVGIVKGADILMDSNATSSDDIININDYSKLGINLSGEDIRGKLVLGGAYNGQEGYVRTDEHNHNYGAWFSFTATDEKDKPKNYYVRKDSVIVKEKIEKPTQ